MAQVKLDPVKYELLYNKLANILEEGKENLRYLSGSYITREHGEVVMGYYLPDGECSLMAPGILVHILNVTGVIRYMNENKFADDPGIGVYDGDMFISNDAYIGGQHVPDCALVAPFFYKGELLGYIAAIAHTTEMGAIEPGGMSPTATESYHEGLHLPPTKLIERGHMRRDLFDLWLRAVREPRGVELDTRAKIAGNETIRRRLTELVNEYGVDIFKKATRQFVEDSEASARAKLKNFRPGIYRHRAYFDTTGATLGDRLAVMQTDLEFTEKGELFIRVPIISPQVKAFDNAHYAGTISLLFCTLLQHIFYDLRWNTGTFRHVRLEIPPGSRLSADREYPVSHAVIGIGYLFQSSIIEAMGRAYYANGMEQEVTAGSNMTNTGIWAGRDQLGRTYANIVSSHASGGGDGARIGKDGINAPVANYNPWVYHADTEGIEVLVPIIQLAVGRFLDSGGYGRWRGGSANYAIEMDHISTYTVNSNLGSNARINANEGMFGGYPSGAVNVARMVNTDFYEKAKAGKPIPTTVDDITKYLQGEYILGPPTIASRPLKHGDFLIHVGTGGPGLGDPIERDPSLIISDIVEKLATIEMSEKIYRVVIDPETLEIDYKKTERMRAQKRQERLRQGIPGQEFLRRMVERRKRRELPKVVLDYLDETSNFCPAFAEQLQAEERLSQAQLKPLEKVNVKDIVCKLTLYVDVVEDENNRKVAVCNKCGFAYCQADENFKLYCLVYERDPEEIHPGILCPDKEWTVYREFYCPGCGTQVEVETTPPGTPILNNYGLKF